MYKERVAEEQLSGRRKSQVVGGQAIDEGLATGRGRLKSMYVGGYLNSGGTTARLSYAARSKRARRGRRRQPFEPEVEFQYVAGVGTVISSK